MLVAVVKIKKLAGENVWQCRAYAADGSRLPDADCEETTRAAAEDTARAMVAPYFDQLAGEAAAAVDAMPIAARKYAAEFRDEMRHRIETTCDSADGSAETAETVRSLLAGALVDIVAMEIDFGGHYAAPRDMLPPDCGYREWRAIYAEATRQLAGEFSAEYAEHRRRMAEIDAANLTSAARSV